MISQRKVERQYNKLITDVKTNDYYTDIDLTNRVNCYVCECGHITKTKDVDQGVTPFMFTCEACGGTARSTMYKDIAPMKKPTFEWYRPKLKQVQKMRKKEEGLLDHVLRGGLDYRKCVVAEK